MSETKINYLAEAAFAISNLAFNQRDLSNYLSC